MNINRIRAVVLRHLFTWPRDLEALAESFWWPSFDVFIWGLMTLYLQQKEGAPAFLLSSVIGAVVLWLFVYRAQQETGLTFLREAWDRNLLNLLTSPLTIWELWIATLILGIIKIMISVVWMAFLAYQLFAFNVFVLGWSLLPFVVSLLVTGWAAGFFINGLIIRYGYRIQSFAWTAILLLHPFSAVVYPVSSLPSWMQAVSRMVPTSYIFEGMRSILTGGAVDWTPVAYSFVLNAVYLFLSLVFFAYCFGKARESGQIMKFS